MAQAKATRAAGAWYEQFTRGVYQCLVDQDAIRNVRVQHNVTLTGRSGATHQIDVYWEFELAGARYRTCLECKAYNSRVKKSHVASFATILEDIGNANGVFVTTVGYQQGAKQLASDRHIRLVTLNPTITKVQTQMQVRMPEYRNLEFVPDRQSAKPLLAAAGRDSFDLSIEGTGDSIELLDAGGLRKLTLHELLWQQPNVPGQHTVSLAGYYLPSEIGLLPMAAVTYELVLHELSRTFTVEARGAVKAILQDVLQNTTTYVKDGEATEQSHGDTI